MGAFRSFLSAGTARHIGICDADSSILDEMQRRKQMPHIIQNWMDPFHQDREVRTRAKADGIQYQAYSTLGTQWQMRTGRNPVLNSPLLKRIAKKYGVSVSAVVLQWA